MMKWEPIETVPRDGTSVLVHNNDAPGEPDGVAEKCWAGNTAVASWWAEENGTPGEWICYMSVPLDPELHFEPTHWMALPSAPMKRYNHHQGLQHNEMYRLQVEQTGIRSLPDEEVIMPDISMCVNKECPERNTCYRYRVRPNSHQTYSDFQYDKEKGCEHWIKIWDWTAV